MPTSRCAVALLCLVAARGTTAEAQMPAADLVILNANVYTADAAHPRAAAVAVRDGRVVFVGNSAGAQALAGPKTQRVDAGGMTVIPGMIDAHAHLMGLGAALRTVDLTGTTSYEEVVDRVRARAAEAPAGAWILGRGWDQNDWANQAFPSHRALSRAVPNHPVYLSRVDGHAALVNAAAIRQAGLDRNTPDPDGGRILRGADGEPTGVLVDGAMSLVGNTIPSPSDGELRSRLVAAMAEANRYGLTGIHDAGVSVAMIGRYRAWAKDGLFTLRDYAMVLGNDPGLEAFLQSGPILDASDGMLTVRSIKLWVDGALGSRGAALLADYTDDPGNRGLITTPVDTIRRVADLALGYGFQLNVHAIGDRGNRLVLDQYAAALAAHPVADHRFRVEHAQILASSDIPRFAKLGVIPSMQGSHQTSDMYWAVDRLGPARIRGAYAWRSLLATGVVIPNGSDFPVESPNPLLSFAAFVSRQDAAGWPAGGWYPEQRTTREEALLSMTMWPAYAAFMEGEVGSLTPGKRADLVILDRDIMTVPAPDIRGTRVLRTILGGRTVYQVP